MLSVPKAFAQQCVFFKDELNCAVSLQAKLKVLHPLCRENSSDLALCRDFQKYLTASSILFFVLRYLKSLSLAD